MPFRRCEHVDFLNCSGATHRPVPRTGQSCDFCGRFPAAPLTFAASSVAVAWDERAVGTSAACGEAVNFTIGSWKSDVMNMNTSWDSKQKFRFDLNFGAPAPFTPWFVVWWCLADSFVLYLLRQSVPLVTSVPFCWMPRDISGCVSALQDSNSKRHVPFLVSVAIALRPLHRKKIGPDSHQKSALACAQGLATRYLHGQMSSRRFTGLELNPVGARGPFRQSNRLLWNHACVRDLHRVSWV